MPDHPLKTLHSLDPELMKHLDGCQDLFYGDGALPRKFKLLIALAFDAAHGADRGVLALARAAMRAGATKAEIAEAIRVAYHLTGVGTLYTAALGLKEIVAESEPIL
jgi:alkylhydroperoxidase/carboxymuconolactone decarboxylase family protein YurZ